MNVKRASSVVMFLPWGVLLACLASAGTACSDAGGHSPPGVAPSSRESRGSAANDGPGGDRALLRLDVGFYVNELREVDSRTQTYRADLYYWLRYPAPVAGDRDESLESIEFVNGELETDVEQERKRVGGDIYVIHRARGRFHFRADYHRYPFDVQRFPIEIEHVSFLQSDLSIRPDYRSYRRSGVPRNRLGLGENVALSDMRITQVLHERPSHTYRSDFGDPSVETPSSTYSRYRMTVVARRNSTSFFIKILIPLAIIQILAYLVFFVPADRLDVAVGLTVTSLLASIAFQISLSDSLPDIGYLTTADRIFHLSYFMVMGAMAQTVLTFNLESEGKRELADRIEQHARWIYPLLFVGGLAFISARL